MCIMHYMIIKLRPFSKKIYEYSLGSTEIELNQNKMY